MAIGKPRGKNGMRPVYVYDPRVGHKVYVGSRKALRGPGGAQELEREKIVEFSGVQTDRARMTCRRYADERWLPLKHGPNTRRPSPTTAQVNRDSLKPFLRDFGDRDMHSLTRVEALDWSRQHPRQAKAVSAMFNDAVDDQILEGNPFANRRAEQPRGRKDISPLTEAEVDQLVQIAEEMWGAYGRVCGAWITFLAWVCCRPGEAFRAEWSDLDFERGEVTIRRVKPPYNTDTVVLPARAQTALLDMPVERVGLLFRTVNGKPIVKNSSRYYWDPVRKAFMRGLTARRRAELLSGRPDFDLYELRHMGASVMADRGLNEFDIAHQLGNSPQVCRETYIHTYRDRTNDRVRLALEQAPKIVNLTARRGA
jgi:integrase